MLCTIPINPQRRIIKVVEHINDHKLQIKPQMCFKRSESHMSNTMRMDILYEIGCHKIILKENDCIKNLKLSDFLRFCQIKSKSFQPSRKLRNFEVLSPKRERIAVLDANEIILFQDNITMQQLKKSGYKKLILSEIEKNAQEYLEGEHVFFRIQNEFHVFD